MDRPRSPSPSHAAGPARRVAGAFARRLSNIFRLGLKELLSLSADKVLLAVIVWAFSFAIYDAATGLSRELRNAQIAIVDLDRSPLTERIAQAFYRPYFHPPASIDLGEVDPLMDRWTYSFVLVFPPHFQRDLQAGRRPELQLAIDATNMGQSFIGAGYIRDITALEVNEFLTGTRALPKLPIELVPRVRYNPNLTGVWFGGVIEVANNIMLMSVILVGAAFVREREHGTLEHLLVMPLTPLEIVAAKVWANCAVVLVAAAFALRVVVQGIVGMPLAGSLPLFLLGTLAYLFSTASIGVFLGTVARSMPQLGLVIILVVLPLELLSGGIMPRESMPRIVQDLMLGAPSTYFVRLTQTILFRGGGLSVAWPDFLAIVAIGTVFFLAALARLRKAVTQTQA